MNNLQGQIIEIQQNYILKKYSCHSGGRERVASRTHKACLEEIYFFFFACS
jgi:hypothetical protein